MRLALVLMVALALSAAGCVASSSQQQPTAPTASSMPTGSTDTAARPTLTPAPAGGVAPSASTAPTEAVGPSAPVARIGDQFAYVRQDGTLWLVNADDASQHEIVSGLSNAYGVTPFSTVSGAAWSPDGKYIAYTTPQSELKLLAVDSGQVTTLDDSSDGLIGTGPLEWRSATTIEYYKMSFGSRESWVPWAATISGDKAPVPTLEQDALDCMPADPNGAFRCWGPAPDPPDTGHPLYLKWPGKDLELVSQDACGNTGDWSPDGAWLPYFDNCQRGDVGTGDVHVLNPETGQNIELGTFSSDEAAWAPSEQRLIYGNMEVDPHTGTAKQLFDGLFSGVEWSHNLSKAMFITSDNALVALDLTSDKRTLLTTYTETYPPQNIHGVWSSDGRFAAYGIYQGGAGPEAVWTVDTTTGATREVLALAAFPGDAVYFSPGWSHFMVFQGSSRKGTIALANADGSSLVQIGEGVPLQQPWRPAE